ncbi:MAG: OmpA family protein [Pseudomonadota bacterium]
MTRLDYDVDDDERDRNSWPLILSIIPVLGIIIFISYRGYQVFQSHKSPKDETAIIALSTNESEDSQAQPLAGGATPNADDPITQSEIIEPKTVEPEPVIEATPIAPPIAPPVEPVKVTVYFDLMKATLTDRAANALSAELRSNSENQIVSIKIDGYTDTAGTVNYNAPLSIERARAVRSFLINAGIDEDRISTEGHGERSLAVVTDDGVREASNRRAVATIYRQ